MGDGQDGQRVSPRTLERLATYLTCLIKLDSAGVTNISSNEMADMVGVDAQQFRKDLSCFGEFGKPGVGYSVQSLRESITDALCLTQEQDVILVGAGNLGSALVAYPAWVSYKFRIVAVFDCSRAKIGRLLWGLEVQDMRRLQAANADLQARIAIIAVPPAAAQSVADQVARAGIRVILNFAPVVVQVPPHVSVRNVCFVEELAVLSYQLNREREHAIMGAEPFERRFAPPRIDTYQAREGTTLNERTKILIVDDDPDIVESLRLVLQSKNYHVVTAGNADEGLSRAKEEKPNLIILDVMMPEGTEGFHYVWNLRREKDPVVREIPILMLTAIHYTTEMRFYPDETDGTYGAGEFLPVQGFIDKPVEPFELVAQVEKLLAKS